MAKDLLVPVELTDAELEMVAAGAPNNVGAAVGGLIAAGVAVQANLTDVLNNVSVLNNNHTEVAVSVLGISIT